MRRQAQRDLCPTCKAPVLAGYDADVAALGVRVDPDALGPQGEALAQLAGRSTYALARRGRHLELGLRDHWQIAGTPAGTRRPGGPQADVVAEHRCQAPALPTIPSALSKLAPAKERKTRNSDRPPF